MQYHRVTTAPDCISELLHELERGFEAMIYEYQTQIQAPRPLCNAHICEAVVALHAWCVTWLINIPICVVVANILGPILEKIRSRKAHKLYSDPDQPMAFHKRR